MCGVARAKASCKSATGKAAPLKRIRPGDRVVYYSPTITLGGKDRLQAFTAIRTVKEGEPYVFDMGNGFKAYRRDVAWAKADEAPILPLLDRLEFTAGKPNWGYQMRFGLFPISAADFPVDRRGDGCGPALTSRPNGAEAYNRVRIRASPPLPARAGRGRRAASQLQFLIPLTRAERRTHVSRAHKMLRLRRRPLPSQHRRQHAVRRAVAVHEGPDVDDDLLAHVDAAFERRRTEMRQQHDLAGTGKLDEFRAHRRLVLEDIEAGARHLARLDEARQRVLVDHLAARGVDDVGLRTNELEPPRRQQVIGGRRVRAIDRDDVHAHQHLVEALPVGGVELLLDARRHAAAIVIVDLQSERLGAPRHRLADAAHADDAEAFAPDAVTEHPGRAPAGPGAIAGEHLGAFSKPPRHRQDQRHGHVGGVLGQ